MYKDLSFFDEIKHHFYYGNMVIRIIMANFAVMIILGLFRLITFLFGYDDLYDLVLEKIMATSNLSELIWQPYSLFSYMFLHETFSHIFFNMLTFYVFGRILNDLLGNRVILPVYVLGGLSGVALYIACYNTFPGLSPFASESHILGASASVMAIMLATTTLSPKYEINLLFIGKVKIIYLATFFIIMDLITIPQSNPGGHIAHLGGALFGFLYMHLLQKGTDLSEPFNKILDTIVNLFSKSTIKTKASVKKQYTKNTPQKTTKNTANSITEAAFNTVNTHKSKPQSTNKQEKVDKILDKIAQSGYESLSSEEKVFLFEYSNEKD